MNPDQMRQIAIELRNSWDAPDQSMAPDKFMASLGIHALADAFDAVADRASEAPPAHLHGEATTKQGCCERQDEQ